MVLNFYFTLFYLFCFLATGSNICPVASLHVSPHADGRLKLWLAGLLLRLSLRVQVLPWPRKHLSLHPNWNQERNAIRSAWPDAEEVLAASPSVQKERKKEAEQPTRTSFMLPWGSSGGIQINSLWYCHRFISCVNLSSPGIFFLFSFFWK